MRTRSIVFIMAPVLVGLAVVYFISKRPKPPESAPRERPFVWQFGMMELGHIAIHLPREEKSEAWTKREDKLWYFDKPNGRIVDMKRWGGGIPVLLSGPASNRLLTENASAEQLEMYGLANPLMRIELILENKETFNIEVGDSTPDLKAYYVKIAESRKVYTVDFTWFNVLQGLVLNPPYPPTDDGK